MASNVHRENADILHHCLATQNKQPSVLITEHTVSSYKALSLNK